MQEPEAYAEHLWATPSAEKIGSFTGRVIGSLPYANFLFFTGEQVEGQQIRANVYSLHGSDISEQDFIDFVSSLTLGD